MTSDRERDLPPDLSRRFQAIWNRVSNVSADRPVTSELINGWSAMHGLDGATTEEKAVGSFVMTPSFVLNVGGIKACFPKTPFKRDASWIAKRQDAEREAALWEKVEWFAPLWIPRSATKKILVDVERYPRERAIEMFNYHTSTLYTIPFEAVCIAQILKQAPSLTELAPLAREAFLAFYSGHRASSIAALIPAIEGGLSRISSNVGHSLPLFQKIDRVVDRAIQTVAKTHFRSPQVQIDWVPSEYLTKEFLFVQDEVAFVVETFGRWLKRFFFAETSAYNGLTWLNRHMFAHGTESSWQQSGNFSRLVVALATLGFVESWHNETHVISPFFQEMNDDGRLLWQQALLQGSIQGRIKRHEQKRYQKFGRLVPDMPTDDGATLRKALISEDCLKDLVRPLRRAGWSVEMDDPDDTALFICVTASAGETRFKIALLFSCATDNAIYRKLAQTCEAILYRGAPYHQAQFAYGIGVHVGPVAGWQPPRAEGSRRAFWSFLSDILRRRTKSPVSGRSSG